MAPSGPAVIRSAKPSGSIGKRLVAPYGVIRPMPSPWYSVNQRFPSRPAVIAYGEWVPIGAPVASRLRARNRRCDQRRSASVAVAHRASIAIANRGRAQNCRSRQRLAHDRRRHRSHITLALTIARSADSANLAGAESELAENFVGVLAQVRSMTPQLGLRCARSARGERTARTRPAFGCSYSKNVSLATNCGSFQIVSKSLTGPHGTSAASIRSSQ